MTSFNFHHRVLLALALLCLGSLANAATVTHFSDNFDADVTGLSKTSLLNWSVINGTVDVLQHGQFGIDCQGSGICIDLDGSSGNAGDMFTNDSFAVGSYILTFELSGSQRSGPDTVRITLGDLDEEITLEATAPWAIYQRQVTLVSEDVLTFSHAGGDNLGLVLDNVSVSAVPLPGALGLLLTAIPGLLAAKARRA